MPAVRKCKWWSQTFDQFVKLLLNFFLLKLFLFSSVRSLFLYPSSGTVQLRNTYLKTLNAETIIFLLIFFFQRKIPHMLEKKRHTHIYIGMRARLHTKWVLLSVDTSRAKCIFLLNVIQYKTEYFLWFDHDNIISFYNGFIPLLSFTRNWMQINVDK